MTTSPVQPRSDLGRSFLVGSVYVSFGNWFSTALNFAIQIAIARMLGPQEFGLYAFVLAINSFVAIVGAFSLGLALIQAREESQELYDTAFILSAGLGLVVLLVSAGIAPLLWIQRSPRAAYFLLVMALAQVFFLVAAIPNARMERALQYGPLTIISMTTSTVPNLVALGMVWAGVGVWSLPIRDVLVMLLALVLKTAYSRYRFRGRFRREAGRTLMRFSRPMFLVRGLDTALAWTDRVVVGAFLGNAATGLYHQARVLTETGVIALRPLFPMVFNLYSRVQDDPARLSRSFSIVNYFLARAMSVGAVVLLLFPEETVQLLLGDEWAETAPLLRWLALYTAFLPVFSNFRQLFNGTGKVSRNVRIGLIQLIVFLPAVFASVLLRSDVGIAAALVAVTLLGLLLGWRASGDILGKASVGLLATPAALIVFTVAMVGGLDALGAVEAIRWFLRPLLPALLFVTALVALEYARLRAELIYLKNQLRSDARPASG
jgi:PST family polysaccharide transporter